MAMTDLSVATNTALDAVTLTDIQGFYKLLDFPRQALLKRFRLGYTTCAVD